MLVNAEIIEDSIVPAGHPWSGILAKGSHLRLIDIHGQQAIDFLCYNADDLSERYHAPNTIKIPGQIYLNKGAKLRSDRARVMMTINDDTCGNHDTIFGCCSFLLDEVRYGKTNPRACQSNFEEALAPHGLGSRDIVPNINFFMSVPVEADGQAAIRDGVSIAGDYVDLKAEMNILAVLSNCPEALNPATGTGPTDIRVIHYKPIQP